MIFSGPGAIGSTAPGTMKNLFPKLMNNHINYYSYISSPVTGLEWSTGLQEVEVPRFDDNGTGWW
jgi:hypothetical protein